MSFLFSLLPLRVAAAWRPSAGARAVGPVEVDPTSRERWFTSLFVFRESVIQASMLQNLDPHILKGHGMDCDKAGAA